MKHKGIFDLTHEAYDELVEDAELVRTALNFGAGYMMGADLPGVAAAIMVALERAYPDRPLAGHLASIKRGRDD